MKNSENNIKFYIEPSIKEGDIVKAGVPGKLTMLSLTPDLVSTIFQGIQLLASNLYDGFVNNSDKGKCPDCAKIEFGIQTNLKGEVFVASVSANSSIKITLEWNSLRE